MGVVAPRAPLAKTFRNHHCSESMPNRKTCCRHAENIFSRQICALSNTTLAEPLYVIAYLSSISFKFCAHGSLPARRSPSAFAGYSTLCVSYENDITLWHPYVLQIGTQVVFEFFQETLFCLLPHSSHLCSCFTCWPLQVSVVMQ